MADVDLPAFTWVFALLICIIILGGVSLLKPKRDYKPFTIEQFDNNCNQFCLARVQWWTVRFIFYYVKPMVAGPLFIATIILISVLAAVRLDDKYYEVIKYVQVVNDTSMGSDCKDVDAYLDSLRVWNDQLTWMLTIYFFQKLFGATLFLNGGGLATVASMIFDPWLYISVIWGTALWYGIADIVTTDSYDSCILFNEDDMIDNLETLLFDLDAFCMILWILCALSLPFGILIDYLTSVIKEWKYGFAGSSSNTKSNVEKQQELNAGVR